MKKYANKILVGLIVFVVLVGLTRGLLSAGHFQSEGKMKFHREEFRFEFQE